MPQHYPFEPIPLPFDYTSLVPHCDPDTLYIHYKKIYVRDIQLLNQLMSRFPAYQSWTLEQLAFGELMVPVTIQKNIRHYAGSAIAHALFFSGLTAESVIPSGDLANQINTTYGSLEKFKQIFKEAAFSVLGAGWVWMIAEQDGSVHIVITDNHEIPQISASLSLFVLDVWEHAYFLQYPAQCDRYIDNWFQVLDWEQAEKQYNAALALPPRVLQ